MLAKQIMRLFQKQKYEKKKKKLNTFINNKVKLFRLDLFFLI